MEDIIDIIVTETTNLITITSQGTDEVIDVNIIDNREDIVLNVTPSVVEININSLTGNFGVNWGQITGTLSNQTDLNTALGLKADLVGGKVPSSQLPSYVDDVVEVANYAALPATGETGKIYITLDTNFMYRWSGSTYIEIKDSSAVWGAITGTLSSQTDLQNALDAKLSTTTAASTYVPYSGAISSVNLGSNNLTVNNVFDGFSSVTASGTQIVLTLASVPSYLVNGSGGQTIKLPDATTLPKGAVYIFNNNQSSGAISVNNNSNTLIVSIPSGGYAEVELTDNANAAGSWDRHFQAPSNVSWSTNTFDYAGSITSATWNGIAVAINRGGTGATTSGAALTNLGAQAQLNGTGFVKVSGTTISYDNSTYVDTTNNQSIGGVKTFTSMPILNAGSGVAGQIVFADASNQLKTVTNFKYNDSTGVLTTQLGALGTNAYNSIAYLPLAGGTMSGVIVGTTATFTNSGSGIGLGVTQSGSGGDGIKITHSAGRAFNILSSANGYGIIINNETIATSVPFTIQKQGADKIVLTDAGAGTFNSSLTASSFVKSSGTSAQFLKADGSVDSSTYALDNSVVHLTGAETISGIKYFFSGSKHDLLFVSETVGYASIAGYSHFKANTNHVEFINSTNTKATKFIHGNAAYEFTMPNASGTIALTSNLSSYLPLSGGTLTGALSGTSATFNSFILGTCTTSTNGDAFRAYASASGGAGSQPGIGYYTSAGSKRFINQLDVSGDTWSVNGSAGASYLTIAQSGAATFSSSVTAGGVIQANSTGQAFKLLSLDTTGSYITFSPSTGSDYGYIGSAYHLLSPAGAGTDLAFRATANMIFASGGATERMRITSSGSLLVGTTDANGLEKMIHINSTNNAGHKISVNGSTRGYLFADATTYYLESANSTRIRVWVNSANGVYMDAGGIAWIANSDERMKTDLVPIEDAVNKVASLRSVIGRYKTDDEGTKRAFLIAQDLQKVLPEAVNVDKETGNLGVSYSEVIPLLVASIKDLKLQLDALKA